jgi:hypothetical protein
MIYGPPKSPRSLRLQVAVGVLAEEGAARNAISSPMVRDSPDKQHRQHQRAEDDQQPALAHGLLACCCLSGRPGPREVSRSG